MHGLSELDFVVVTLVMCATWRQDCLILATSVLVRVWHGYSDFEQWVDKVIKPKDMEIHVRVHPLKQPF